MKKILAITCLLLWMTATNAQNDIVQNLSFYRVLHNTESFNSNDYEADGKKPFYIYRNCVYRIILSKGGNWLIRITDIRNDSIYYEHFGPQTSFRKDTLLRLHPYEINSILTYEQSLGQMFNTIHLVNYRPVFSYSSLPKGFPLQSVILYSRDSSKSEKVELVPFLHAKNTALLFLKCNRPYYYNQGTTLDCEEGVALQPPPPYPRYTRDIVWFTPSRARKINGLNVGIVSFGIGRDSLAIAGVNVNADLVSALFSMYLPFIIPRNDSYKFANIPDSISFKLASNKMYGVSISGGGLLGDIKLHGMSVNGLLCELTVMNGICITGLINHIDDFKGLAIAGAGNTSIKGTGLQIGLVNKCKKLQGVQLGLWNINSKRKLPLINWDFSKKSG